MKISIIGLGVVGSATAIGFAKLGHKVIGVDIVRSKVNKINRLNKKRLKATLDIKEAILNSNISFVCVETPSRSDGDISLTALKKVSNDIGNILVRLGRQNHIIVFRSTMFPGSLEILKNILEKNAGRKIDVAINPEFLREKTAIKDFFNPSFIVVGSEDKNVAKKVMTYYKGIKAKRFIVDVNIAQMVKYVNNSFHALKVSYTNEIATICKKVNVDSKKLMGLFCEDTQLNISPYYFKPGKAYDGKCLPKDLSALQKMIKKLKINCPVIKSISESNEEQKKRDKK